MRSAVISFPIFGNNFSIDPPASFSLFGKLIYFYGVVIAVGFLLAAIYAVRRSHDFGLRQDDIYDMILFAVPSGFICARLYYVIFTPSDYFGAGKWLNIFKIREGGLAIYGGIIGAVLCVIIFSKVRKIPLGTLLDIGSLGLLIGQAIGRWGNFFNREAFGAVTNVPWKMGLTTDAGTIYVHPTFLYESLWDITGFVLLHFFSKKRRDYDGQIFLMYVAWYGLGRFFIEGLRSDSLYIPNTGVRVSQLLAALSCLAAVFIILHQFLRGEHTPEKLYVNRVKTGTETLSAVPSNVSTEPEDAKSRDGGMESSDDSGGGNNTENKNL